MITDKRRSAPSRREFLKGVGAASAGMVAGSLGGGSGLVPSTAVADPRAIEAGGSPARRGAPASSVDFGRIFPNLPPFAEVTDTPCGPRWWRWGSRAGFLTRRTT